MRALVTGGAGFIGSNLVDKLIKDGHEVIVVDNLSSGKILNVNSNATFYNHDIRMPFAKEMISGVDTVFHCAAIARVQPSIENPFIYHDNNVNGIFNLLELCRAFKVKRFVYSSSSSVYGDAITPTSESCPTDPMSPYALNKLMSEQYCKLYNKLYGMETVCLRYFNVYGERQLLEGAYACVLGIFMSQKSKGEFMTIRGDGEQRRDFTYVGDVVDANIRAATSDKVGNGEVINIGNGDNRSINDIAVMVDGKGINIDPVIEPKETLADNKLAYDLLGWKPTKKIEDWVKKYYEEYNK
tara:strand:+ start:259 stop:1152 length:894 start_codon:yes stop_codon:yes gene_type:complete